MTNDSRAVAKYIAEICDKYAVEKKLPQYNYNNTKIQKLLYFSYGCILAFTESRLVDEQPCAWKYGPVFPDVFFYIKNTGNIKFYEDNQFIPNEKEKTIIDNLIKNIGKYSANTLSLVSHEKGSPWEKVSGDTDFDDITISELLKIKIPDDIIKPYFKKEFTKFIK
ncbi:MAG: DUF4065 domain-containing protein [Hydrotalea sp.]|nr:DUF4065 domain-containing protein [Hydrotalea sp.]